MTDGKGQYITQCYLLQFLLCGFFFFPRQSHIHIQLKKKKKKTQSECQAAPNTSGTPQVKVVSFPSNIRELQVGSTQFPVYQGHLSDELVSLTILKWPWLPYKSTVSTWSFKKMLYCCLQ